MRKTILIIMLLLALAMFASCEGEKPAKTVGCIVYSNRANSELPNFDSEAVRQLSEDVSASYGTLFGICMDGDSQVVGNVGFEDVPERIKKDGSKRIKSDAKKRVNSFLAGISKIVADDPEVDVLDAMCLAVRSINSVPDAAKRVIIVIDSDISTIGQANFRNNLMCADPQKIADDLYERDAIPDFSNITVFFQQTGDVCSPQMELTQKQVNHLKEIWKAIVEKTGGTVVFDDTLPIERKEKPILPVVTPVNFPGEPAISYNESSDIDLSDVIAISEDQIRFKGDSAEYYDSDAALCTLKPIADYLNDQVEVNILLVGTAAGDENNEYTRTLSKKRAEKVRDTLIELGVPENRMRAVGLGNDDPWHISGAGTEGNLASQNRRVMLLDADSETVKAIVG